MTPPTAEYDSPWKEALEHYFEPFLAFFFPQAQTEIDWSRGYEFLDQELQQVVRDAELGKRLVDKLVKVWLLNGEETWILVHVEVQGQTDTNFAERMFVYNYRIFDRYRRTVISLAVLGDEQANWRPQSFGYGLWGCQMQLHFPVVKLLDYETCWSELEQSHNPFAVVVMAHLRTQSTRRNPQGRFEWKRRLVLGLYERGYRREEILQLFRLIDWMMVLPEPLELNFRDELRRYEEEQQMPYITSIERLGRREERQEMIVSLLKIRFGEVDQSLARVIEPLVQLPPEEFTPLLLQLSRAELIARFG